MIGIEISGLVDVQRFFNELGKHEFYESIIHEVGEKAKEYAEKLCPVGDTGDMKDSIDVTFYRDGFVLEAGTEYAVFNEYGSIFTPIGSVSSPKPAKKVGFRPFLRPALYKATGEVDYIFGQKMARISMHGGRA